MRSTSFRGVARVFCAAVSALLSASSPAEDSGLVSGPPQGTPLHPIPCYAERGTLAGKEFDAAREADSSPAAFLFIHELSRNTAPVIRELDRLGEEHAILGFRWFPILLHGDRTEGENMLERVNGSLRLHQPLVLSLGGLEGPGDYALNRRCALTLVLADEGKVTRSVALTDTGPADFPRLKDWVESVAGKVPEDAEALRTLLLENLPVEEEALRALAVAQMLELRELRRRLASARAPGGRPGMGGENRGRGRRMAPGEGEEGTPGEEPGDDAGAEGEDSGSRTGDLPGVPRREGKPPEDPELNGSLRAFIRKTNDDPRCEEIFQQISARAAESPELETEAVEMFKLMLSFRDRYGTEKAQDLAETFLREHGERAGQPEP